MCYIPLNSHRFSIFYFSSTSNKTMMKNPFCRPRQSAAAARKSGGFTPMSLLDRLREAVFRLIMLSALSKGSDAAARSSAPPSDHYYNLNDPHHSEAVADCIEFIRKSAITTGSDDAAAAQVVV